MRLSKSFVLRLWAYFRRAHSTYLAFIISFANFVVIQYRLLVEHVSFLRLLFANLTAFAVAFFAVYVPLAIVLGWLDYKRLSMPVDMELGTRANPWTRDLAKALYLIADGKYEEAKKVLERWISER